MPATPPRLSFPARFRFLYRYWRAAGASRPVSLRLAWDLALPPWL